MFKGKERKALSEQIDRIKQEIDRRMDRPPGILKEDGYPDVQAFKRTYDAATALVEQYNRNLDAWERQVNGERQPQQAPPEKESIRKKLRDMERRPNAGMPSVGRNLGTATMIRTLRQKNTPQEPPAVRT